MGVNKIAVLLKSAMTSVGVDCKKQKVSSYSARKTMLQSGADSLLPGAFLSKMAGQKSLESKLAYLTNKETTHKAASLCISRQATGINDSNDFHDVYMGLRYKKKNTYIVPRVSLYLSSSVSKGLLC